MSSITSHTTKFVATAVVVASLGFASSAAADEGFAQGEPVPGQAPVQVQVPAQGPADPAAPAQDPAAPAQGQGQMDPAQQGQVDPAAQAAGAEPIDDPEGEGGVLHGKPPTKQDLQRFERYCNMKVGEPSHSDKDFCIAFRKQQGTGTGNTTPPQHTTPKTDPNTSDDTDPYVSDYDYTHKPYPASHYRAPVKHYAPTATASTGSLPFTGLELWQVALMGALLIGGGLAARRLLTR